jgi:hypothetical protein
MKNWRRRCIFLGGTLYPPQKMENGCATSREEMYVKHPLLPNCLQAPSPIPPNATSRTLLKLWTDTRMTRFCVVGRLHQRKWWASIGDVPWMKDVTFIRFLRKDAQLRHHLNIAHPRFLSIKLWTPQIFSTLQKLSLLNMIDMFFQSLQIKWQVPSVCNNTLT